MPGVFASPVTILFTKEPAEYEQRNVSIWTAKRIIALTKRMSVRRAILLSAPSRPWDNTPHNLVGVRTHTFSPAIVFVVWVDALRLFPPYTRPKVTPFSLQGRVLYCYCTLISPQVLIGLLSRTQRAPTRQHARYSSSPTQPSQTLRSSTAPSVYPTARQGYRPRHEEGCLRCRRHPRFVEGKRDRGSHQREWRICRRDGGRRRTCLHACRADEKTVKARGKEEEEGRGF